MQTGLAGKYDCTRASFQDSQGYKNQMSKVYYISDDNWRLI